jgi:hypothetical protein
VGDDNDDDGDDDDLLQGLARLKRGVDSVKEDTSAMAREASQVKLKEKALVTSAKTHAPGELSSGVDLRVSRKSSSVEPADQRSGEV